MWLPPNQMSTAVLTCIIPQTVQIGAKDKITFSSRELSLTSQAAILTVTSPTNHAAVSFRNEIRRSKLKAVLFCVRIDAGR